MVRALVGDSTMTSDPMTLLDDGNATRRISRRETLRGRANYYKVPCPAVNLKRARPPPSTANFVARKSSGQQGHEPHFVLFEQRNQQPKAPRIESDVGGGGDPAGQSVAAA